MKNMSELRNAIENLIQVKIEVRDKDLTDLKNHIEKRELEKAIDKLDVALYNFKRECRANSNNTYIR